MSIRVIVVDDHPIFRLGLATSLREMDGIDIIGEASTAGEVAELVSGNEPDIVLLDLHLPDGSGLDVNRWIARDHPNVIRSVMAGDVVLDPGVARAIADLAQLRGEVKASPFPQLSRRELDILELVARGLDNPAIARELVLTSKTVRNHVSNVLAKINAGDRSQAIVLARRSGFGQTH